MRYNVFGATIPGRLSVCLCTIWVAQIAKTPGWNQGIFKVIQTEDLDFMYCLGSLTYLIGPSGLVFPVYALLESAH